MSTATTTATEQLSLAQTIPTGWWTPREIEALTNIPENHIRAAFRARRFGQYSGDAQTNLRLRGEDVQRWIHSENIEWQPTRYAAQLHRAQKAEDERHARQQAQLAAAKKTDKSFRIKSSREQQKEIMDLQTELRALRERVDVLEGRKRQ